MGETIFKERSSLICPPVIGRFHDIEIQKGSGCYLYDTNNEKYLDFSSGIAVTSTGHCHPDIVKAITSQTQKLIHACIGVGYYEAPIKLAEQLCQLLAPDSHSVFFTQSGSEANETALKLAKYVTNRKKIIAFQGGFHGRTLGAFGF